MVTLLVDQTPIQVDKSRLMAASPYFRAMFCGHFAESSATEIPIHDITLSSMQTIVSCLENDLENCLNDLENSSNDLEIKWDDLELSCALDIMYTASVLQFQRIQSACAAHFSHTLNTETCLHVMICADQLGLDKLYDCADLMSRWAFETVTKTRSFQNLTVEQVECYLAGNLNVSSEYAVFQAICFWIQENVMVRRSFTSSLLNHLQYGKLSSAEIQDMLCHPYIRDSPQLLLKLIPPVLLTYVTCIPTRTLSVWRRAVKRFRKIDQVPSKSLDEVFLTSASREKRTRHVRSKVYVSTRGVYADLSTKHDVQGKLYYLDTGSGTLKLSKQNAPRGNVGNIVNIFPVESEVWIISDRDDSREPRNDQDGPISHRGATGQLGTNSGQKVEPTNDTHSGKTGYSFWKFNTCTSCWEHISRLPDHVRSHVHWITHLNNRVFLVYEPFHQTLPLRVDVYDVITKRWNELRVNYGGGGSSSVECDSRIVDSSSHIVEIGSRTVETGSQKVESDSRTVESGGQTVDSQFVEIANTKVESGSETVKTDTLTIERDKSSFFTYKDHLYIVVSWFELGYALDSSPLESGFAFDSSPDEFGGTPEWKRINWCSYVNRDRFGYKIMCCVVDRSDIYGLSFTGLYRMAVRGENVLRCSYMAEYGYGDLHNDHDLCGRLFSKVTHAWDGRLYCWRKAEMAHLTVTEIDTGSTSEVELEYETDTGLARRWNGFEIVLDTAFVSPMVS
ncbi:hypothetical protein M8J75_009691 [Diaphorina citri]|nr:hypothetical protein M8J75_009691 [Diaphorina citri]